MMSFSFRFFLKLLLKLKKGEEELLEFEIALKSKYITPKIKQIQCDDLIIVFSQLS